MTDDAAIRRWMSRYRLGYCDMDEAIAAIRPIIEAEYEKARGDIADLLNEEEARRGAGPGQL